MSLSPARKNGCRTVIHAPRVPNPRFKGKSGLGYRGDSMVEFDWAVGELLKTLDEQGLAENTLVIFSSDNGPVYDDGYEDETTVPTSTKEVDRGHDGSGPYRGGKYQIYEGGTRVPLIARWPAKIKPAISGAMISQIDLIASFSAMLGMEIPAGQAIDSRNNLPALLGEDTKGLTELVEEANNLALRDGPWKFVLKSKPKMPDELYNLDEDIGEMNNIITKQPERAATMKARLIQIRDAKAGHRSLK
jgi:arylsulfatase A